MQIFKFDARKVAHLTFKVIIRIGSSPMRAVLDLGKYLALSCPRKASRCSHTGTDSDLLYISLESLSWGLWTPWRGYVRGARDLKLTNSLTQRTTSLCHGETQRKSRHCHLKQTFLSRRRLFSCIHACRPKEAMDALRSQVCGGFDRYPCTRLSLFCSPIRQSLDPNARLVWSARDDRVRYH